MIGHKCEGGGATIENSPIHVHFHIHTNNETIFNKVMRSINGITGTRHKAIENASGISEAELQRLIIRECENR